MRASFGPRSPGGPQAVTLDYLRVVELQCVLHEYVCTILLLLIILIYLLKIEKILKFTNVRYAKFLPF